MSVARKLGILILIALIPLIALSGLWLAGEASQNVAAPRAALSGTRTVESLISILRSLEELRGLAARRAAGDTSVDEQMRELSEEVAASIDQARVDQPSVDLRDFVARRVDRLPPGRMRPGEPVAVPAGGTAAEAIAAYQQLVDTYLSAVQDAGAYSGLMSVADYRERLYANLALTTVPRLLDHLYIVRDLGRVAIQRGMLLPDEERLLVASLGSVRTRLDRMLVELEDLDGVGTNAAREPLRGVDGRRATVEEFLRYTRDQLVSGDVSAADEDELRRLSDQAIAALSIDRDILADLSNGFAARQQAGKARIAVAAGVTVLALVAICALAIILLRDVVRKLNIAVNFSTAIASGRRNVGIADLARDEFGTLHRALRDMLESIRAAETRLQESNEALQQQARIRQAQIDAAATIRREPEPENLARAIVTQVATTVGAAAACLYLARNGSLEAAAGYCLPPDREQARLKLGSGVAGQAAVQRAMVRPSEVPDGALRLATCAGNADIKDVVAIPLEFAETLVGAIEITALSPLDDDNMEYLEASSELIAAGLYSALTRVQIEELLEETTQQAESLRHQREELQQANSELERRASELEAQQLELEEVNRELQGQGQLLERQKEELEATNRALEVSRAELADKAASLEKSSRYKSEFLANMSHELRTPLNSILILSKLMEENDGEQRAEDVMESAATIHAAGRDLLALINDILDLAKVESGKLSLAREKLDLRRLAADLERSFAPQMLERGLEFIVSVTEECPAAIESDRLRVEQVLRNFLSNAVKFTDAGRVELAIDATDEAGFAVAVSVTDSGVGISADQHDLIFEAFRQADGSTERRHGGTGLGLSIARAFAERLGGHITLESTPGRGSRFSLLLPAGLTEAQPAATPARERQVRPPPDVSGTAAPADAASPLDNEAPRLDVEPIDDDRDRAERGDGVVLIIEDDRDYAGLLVGGVRAAGCKAVVAADAERGLDDARALMPLAVILDHRLPGMSGASALARLKLDGRTRHIPVHVISVDDIGRHVRRQGAAGFVHKPASPKDVEQLIADLVARSSPREQRILLVEDDDTERKAVAKLLSGTGAQVIAVESADEALTLVRDEAFECVVLDLKLRGRSGFGFLRALEQESIVAPPIIVYTGRDLSDDELEGLEQQARSIIIKGVKSTERLLDEATLFLHSVEDELPDQFRDMLARARRREPPFDDYTVLIVDDDMRNVYSLRRALHAWGLGTDVATTGSAALSRLAAKPRVDLVLMDIMLPEMDGLEATRRIRSNPATADLPIIAVTAKAMRSDRDACLAAGANDYIAKPVDIDRLLDRVEVWLR